MHTFIFVSPKIQCADCPSLPYLGKLQTLSKLVGVGGWGERGGGGGGQCLWFSFSGDGISLRGMLFVGWWCPPDRDALKLPPHTHSLFHTHRKPDSYQHYLSSGCPNVRNLEDINPCCHLFEVWLKSLVCHRFMHFGCWRKDTQVGLRKKREVIIALDAVSFAISSPIH